MNQHNPADLFTRDTPEGFEYFGATKFVTSHRTQLFSGGWPKSLDWPIKNVHTDLEFAKNCGLPARNSSGAMLLAYLSEMLTDLFGERWLSEGTLKIKFTKPASIDDRIIAKIRLISKIEKYDIVQFNMEAWCENQFGHQLAIGEATAFIE